MFMGKRFMDQNGRIMAKVREVLDKVPGPNGKALEKLKQLRRM